MEWLAKLAKLAELGEVTLATVTVWNNGYVS